MLTAMEELPFLVVYGAWLWKGVAVLFVAGAAWLWSLLRRRTLRRRAAAARAMLGAPAQELAGASDGSILVVEGILRGDGLCERYVDGKPAAAASFRWGRDWLSGSSTIGSLDRRAQELWLDTAEGPIELRGNITVLAGSTEDCRRSGSQPRATRQRLCADAGCASPPITWYDEPSHRWLAAGDRIRARGRVRRSAGRTGAGYRGDAGAWSLEADAGDQAVPLLFTGAPSLRRPLLRQWVWPLVSGLALFFAGAYVLGACALHESKAESYNMVPQGRPFSLPAVDRLTLAAATPFHRSRALERIESELAYRRTAEQRRLDAELAIDELRHECGHAVWLLVEHGQYRAALERSRGCPQSSFRERTTAHASLAEFAAASDTLAKQAEHKPATYVSGDDVAIHILAKRWSRAAAAARKRADEWRSSPSPAPVHARVWSCLALALDVKAGKRDALSEMRARNQPGAHEACTILVADLTGTDDAIRRMTELPLELDKIDGEYLGYDLTRARDYVLLEHDPELVDNERPLVGSSIVGGGLPSDAIVGTGELGLAVRLAPRLPQLTACCSELADRLWAELVLALLSSGQYDAAAQQLAAARADLQRSWYAAEMQIVLALWRGQDQQARSLAADRPAAADIWSDKLALTDGNLDPYSDKWMNDSIYQSLADSLRRAAASGDGEWLRGRLEADGFHGWRVLPLLAGRITRNRGPLREFLRLAAPPHTVGPAPWLLQLGARLLLAERLGDEALASHYRTLAKRHYDAIADPEVAMLLYFTSL